jgi:ribosomal protein L40E
VTEDRRCPNCGALVSEDAEWCGQCFVDLREREPEPDPEPAPSARAQPRAAVAPGAQRTPAFWPCTVCGAENPIVLDVCATCGTPFATVMRGESRKHVDPRFARTRSLVFPGAGHAALGYPMDGFARGAVFALSVVVAVFLAVTVPHTALMLFAIGLLVATAAGVYLLSLAETNQLAAGGGLIVPSRLLLWGAVGVMFLIVAVIALSIAGNARR